jgi:hypothetical protein
MAGIERHEPDVACGPCGGSWGSRRCYGRGGGEGSRRE